MKNKEQSTNKSQLHKANLALVAIADNVTADDKKASGYVPSTVWMYLKGNGKDLGTAMKLLDFFTGRISDREKKLKSVIS